MAGKTKIEWATDSWNPIRGCSRVSPECLNCYAERVAARFSGKGQPYEGIAVMTDDGPRWTGKVTPATRRILEKPLRWTKPRLVFVNSMSDLFHESLSFLTIDVVFGVMGLCWKLDKPHTFQVLTKRAKVMKDYLTDPETPHRVASAMKELRPGLPLENALPEWPLPNVWMGVSVGNQEAADERVQLLLDSPAAVRWLSCEPLIGPVELRGRCKACSGLGRIFDHTRQADRSGPCRTCDEKGWVPSTDGLGWLVIGGESGPGSRPMHPDWARDIRDQGDLAHVPVFFKQWGRFIEHEHGEPDRVELFQGQGTEEQRKLFRNGSLLVSRQGSTYESLDDMPDGVPCRLMHPVGKKAAGAILDGETIQEMPPPYNPEQVGDHEDFRLEV